ncbi:ComF family protein [Alishewanella sp. d11]|uniref:ComF family protein n=1 Tax=Alishewanella sp. d11 TaxID=3414030 RepID=UPI003BF865D1
MNLVNKVRQLWQLLLPSPCLWCSLAVADHQQLLCADCQQALPALPYEVCHYNLLWLPAVSSGLAVVHFDSLLSLGWYQLPYQHWIRRWKFQGDPFAAALMQQQFQILLLRYAAAGQPLPEAIVYVPMHAQKEHQRGFNQARILAESAAKQLQIPLLDVLKRSKETVSQVGLNRQERLRNLTGAFQLVTTTPLPAHLALVDDVVTTGTTANQLAILLRQHGVTQLSLWTLAVTPQADHSSA